MIPLGTLIQQGIVQRVPPLGRLLGWWQEAWVLRLGRQSDALVRPRYGQQSRSLVL